MVKLRSMSSGAASLDLRTSAERMITMTPKAITVRANSPSAVDRKWAPTCGTAGAAPEGGGLEICTPKIQPQVPCFGNSRVNLVQAMLSQGIVARDDKLFFGRVVQSHSSVTAVLAVDAPTSRN